MVEYFASIGGLATLSVLITGVLNKTFNINKDWVKQLISWAVPIVLSIAGFALQLGMFAAFGPLTSWVAWVYTVLAGFGTGLVSNGIYDINAVENLFKKLNTKNTEKTESVE